jgi:hypothetical protein
VKRLACSAHLIVLVDALDLVGSTKQWAKSFQNNSGRAPFEINLDGLWLAIVDVFSLRFHNSVDGQVLTGESRRGFYAFAAWS